MPSLARAVVLALGAASSAQALKVQLVADVTRDGVINDDDRNSPDKRALFLANIADTNGRCQQSWELRRNGLQTCHDANGLELRNEKHLARFQLDPCPVVDDGAIGTISADHKAVHLFYWDGKGWQFAGPRSPFRADMLRQGIQLGIDSRDVRRPGWDGTVTVTMWVQDGDEPPASGTALFELAPILIPHVLQPPIKLLTMKPPPQDAAQQQFVSLLGDASKKANLGELLQIGTRADFRDKWAQDYLKPGYMSIPGPKGPVGLDIMIVSPQRRPYAHSQVFWQLRDQHAGAVQPMGFGVTPADDSTIDSYGNLDTIPPYTRGTDGVSFPNGRPIAGIFGNKKPLVLDFLAAQGTPALEINSGWLKVGHIDEFMQFLPDPKNAGKWILAINNPVAGLELLQEASRNGHGKDFAFSRHNSVPVKRGTKEEEEEKRRKEATDKTWAKMQAEFDEEKGRAWADIDEEAQPTKQQPQQPTGKGKGKGKADNDNKTWSQVVKDGKTGDQPNNNNALAKGKMAKSGDDTKWAQRIEEDDQKERDDQKNLPQPVRDISIDEMLGIPRIQEYNEYCYSRIQDALKIIRDETGVEKIIEIPVVYLPKRLSSEMQSQRGYNVGGSAKTSTQQTYQKYKDWLDVDGIEKNPQDKTFGDWGALSAYPNAINGIVLPDGKYLAPKTWGPKIKAGPDGQERDIFFDAVNAAYSDAGYTITEIDDWYSHHSLHGDLHCGTNMIRDVTKPWW